VDGQTFDRVLSERDYFRLKALSVRHPRLPFPGFDSERDIAEILDDAIVVPLDAVPVHIAALHSEIVLRDTASGVTTRITLCLPTDSEPATGRVSVLSPLGMSLIGRPAGFVARWRCPSGEERAAELAAVRDNPDAVRASTETRSRHVSS
jgi:regulator of nucleoside diphosphate kinase